MHSRIVDVETKGSWVCNREGLRVGQRVYVALRKVAARRRRLSVAWWRLPLNHC